MRTSILVISVMIIASSAPAVQVFTDRATFEAALGSYVVEDFESAPIVGTGSSGATAFQDFGAFSVSSAPNAVKVLGVPNFGAGNTTPGGSKYLYLDRIGICYVAWSGQHG